MHTTCPPMFNAKPSLFTTVPSTIMPSNTQSVSNQITPKYTPTPRPQVISLLLFIFLIFFIPSSPIHFPHSRSNRILMAQPTTSRTRPPTMRPTRPRPIHDPTTRRSPPTRFSRTPRQCEVRVRIQHRLLISVSTARFPRTAVDTAGLVAHTTATARSRERTSDRAVPAAAGARRILVARSRTRSHHL